MSHPYEERLERAFEQRENEPEGPAASPPDFIWDLVAPGRVSLRAAVTIEA